MTTIMYHRYRIEGVLLDSTEWFLDLVLDQEWFWKRYRPIIRRIRGLSQ